MPLRGQYVLAPTASLALLLASVAIEGRSVVSVEASMVHPFFGFFESQSLLLCGVFPLCQCRLVLLMSHFCRKALSKVVEQLVKSVSKVWQGHLFSPQRVSLRWDFVAFVQWVHGVVLGSALKRLHVLWNSKTKNQIRQTWKLGKHSVSSTTTKGGDKRHTKGNTHHQHIWLRCAREWNMRFPHLFFFAAPWPAFIKTDCDVTGIIMYT